MNRTSVRVAVAAGGFGTIALFSVLVAYPSVHLTLQEDEGYVLIALKSFLQHGSLYDKVYSQYGPFPYEFWGTIFSVFGMSVTPDVGRDVTLVAWVLTALLAGLATARMTRSLLLGFAVQLVVFAALTVATKEPMHPGSLICLLLVGTVLSASFFGERAALWPAAAFGALLAALVLTKVNVGGFAVISVALACFCVYPALSSRRMLRLVVEIIFVAVPILLVATKADLGWARAYGLHVSIAALAVVVVLRARSPHRRRDEELVWIGAGLLVVTAAICIAIVAAGTSPGGLFDGVIAQPLHQGEAFSVALHFPTVTWLIDALGLGGALGYWWLRRRRPELGQVWTVAVGIISVVVGVELGLAVIGKSLPPISDGAASLPVELLAFSWVALIPPSVESDPSTRFVRMLLPILAVLQPLHAFPVAGSQVLWGTFLLVLVGAICVANGVRDVADVLRTHARRTGVMVAAGFGFAAVVLAVLLVNTTIRQPLDRARAAYDAAIPLDLPGAYKVRLSEPEVMLYRTLTQELDARCPSFLTEPGMDAYYFWTRQEPPTGLNATAWSQLFSTGQQQQVIDETRSIKNLCVLRNVPLAEVWTGGVAPEGRLVNYIRRDFRPIQTWGPFELLRRAAKAGK